MRSLLFLFISLLITTVYGQNIAVLSKKDSLNINRFNTLFNQYNEIQESFSIMNNEAKKRVEEIERLAGLLKEFSIREELLSKLIKNPTTILENEQLSDLEELTIINSLKPIQDSLSMTISEKLEIKTMLIASRSQLSEVVNLRLDYSIAYKDSLNTIYKELLRLRKDHSLNGISNNNLNEILKKYEESDINGDNKNPDNDDEGEEKIYVLFGDERLIAKDDILNDSIANQVFKTILEDQSEIHLGNFWIPKDGQKIPLLKYRYSNGRKIKKDSIIDHAVYRSLNFDKIDIEIFEGSLVDIKVYLKEGVETYLFENKIPVSLLRYTKSAHKNYLYNSALQTKINSSTNYSSYRLRLTDVLRYFSNPGRNFIPDNQSFSFPIKSADKQENKKEQTVYELYQDVSLQNVLNLRTYTDFISLFGDSPNGIAQFEGDAEFFVNPFNVGKSGKHIFFFKKIKPYISYANIDEDNRNLVTIGTPDPLGIQLSNRLDQIQKSFLDLGVKLDFASFKFNKENPVEFNGFASLRYQVAQIDLENSDINTYSALGTGLGVNLEFRRFENFEFDLSGEFTYYNHDSFNDIPNFDDSLEFWVFRAESEISYFPGTSKNNAIFLRAKVFNDLGKDIDRSFFQLQFGYKFNLGLQQVRAQN